MAQAISIQNEDINGIVGGGAVALLTPSTTNYYNLYSSSATALTGAVTVAASAVPAGFVVFNMLLSTSLTYSGAGAFTFFGTSVSEGYMKAGTLFQATYDGSAYTVSIFPSFSQSGFIQGSDIADTTIALTKLAALTSAQIIVGSAGNVPTAVAMSGDATISNAGAVTIANSAVTTAKINAAAVTTEKIADEAVTTAKLDATLQSYLNQNITLAYVNVPIPSAEVLTGNSIPVVLVGAVAGKIIKPLFVLETITYDSATYTTNLTTQVIYDGATDAYMTAPTSFLGGTTTKTVEMQYNAINAVTDTQILANADLLWKVATGDPLVGDSDLTVTVIYVLLDA